MLTAPLVKPALVYPKGIPPCASTSCLERLARFAGTG